MSFQVTALLGRPVFCIHITFVIRQRHLGVDHHMAIVGEVQDKVRNQALAIITLSPLAGLISQCFLSIKLLAFFQFQVFEQLFEFQFTEVSLYLHLTRQSARQTVGRFSDLCTFLHIDLDSLIQPREGFRLLFLGLVKRLLHILQALLERIDNLRHLFLVFLAELGLTLLEHLFRSGLHLLPDKFELVFDLLLVHLFQSLDLPLMNSFLLQELLGECFFQLLHLTVVSNFSFVHLLFVGSLLRLDLFRKVLYIRLLNVSLRRQFDDVVD